jgi:integrase/recombinase XerD
MPSESGPNPCVPTIARVQIVLVGDRRIHLTEDQAAYAGWLRGRGFSPDSIRTYAGCYNRAERALGLLELVDANDLLAWLVRHGPSTRRTYSTALTSVYDWLNKRGRRDGHPLRLDIRERPIRPPAPKRKPRALRDDQVAELLTTATGDPLTWVLLGLRQGLRVHEIAKFRGEELDVEVLQVTGKGGKTVDLPTDPQVWELAQSYPRRGFWFPSDASPTGHVHRNTITRRVSKLLDGVGAAGSTHRLRHTYATTLLRGGMDIEEVRELLRHNSLTTTQIYLSAEWDRMTRASKILDQAYRPALRAV